MELFNKATYLVGTSCTFVFTVLHACNKLMSYKYNFIQS